MAEKKKTRTQNNDGDEIKTPAPDAESEASGNAADTERKSEEVQGAPKEAEDAPAEASGAAQEEARGARTHAREYGRPYGRRPHSSPPPLFEWAMPEGLKKKLEAGLDSFTRGERGRLREMMGEFRIPKEFYNFLMGQVDETKGAVLKLVGREFREFLEKTNLADELARMLTKLSFEVRTEIRFRPNEKAMPVPDIDTKVEVHSDSEHGTEETDETEPETKPGDSDEGAQEEDEE